MNVKTCFSERLKGLREGKVIDGKVMSQSQLAEAIGVSRGSISFYENADRTADIETLYSVAKYFDVSVEYLLGISPVEGSFTPIMGNAENVKEDLSAYSKMRAAEIYTGLVSCAGTFEEYFAARSGKKDPWVCNHLFASIKTLITAYESVAIYLQKSKSLSDIICKYKEVAIGSDQSLDLMESLSRWMGGGTDGNSPEERR